MSKPKHPKRAPPRFRRVVPGQVWFVQKQPGSAVLTASVDEVTRETVMLSWLNDGAVQVRPDSLPLRWARCDLKFLEKVAG